MSRSIHVGLLAILMLALVGGCSKKKAPEAPDAAVSPPPPVVIEHPPTPQLAAVPILNPQVVDPADKRPLTEQLADKKLAPGVAIQMLRIEPPTQEELSAPHLKSFPEATKRALITYRKVQEMVPELRCCPPPDPNYVPVDEAELAKKRIEEERKKRKGK
ncbi:MAG: hypothetical protein GYA21_17715 [Myxococcales bacterium]|nr:hypothetical protein [Myxococcales bacterium]